MVAAVKIGFISDIHEDYVSLCAAVTALEKAQCEALVCLGDIVGFSFPFQRSAARRNADACVALVRDQCTTAVAGNHDLYALRRIPTHAAGFPYDDDWYERDEESRQRIAGSALWRYDDFDLPQRLSAPSRAVLAELPEYRTVRFGEIALFFSQFRYPDLSGSVVASLRSDHLHEHFDFARERNCLHSFSGHGHPQGFAQAENGRLVFGGFGRHALHHGQQWIVCPAVARTDRASGVMMFDTSTFHLDVIALHIPSRTRG